MRLFSKKKSMTHKIYCAKNIPCDDENCILDTHLCTCDKQEVNPCTCVTPKQDWEERFDHEFNAHHGEGRVVVNEKVLKDFIRQLLAEARKEERKRILEACGKQVEEESAIYGTDKHGLNLNDLTEIIYPDK
jgi:hypothetical protein